MMLKQCLLILMLMGAPYVRLYAQEWSEEDSVWLSGILSGKDTIRINPEFQKAIRSGTFIHLEDEPGQQILEAPAELPILKDFSEYLRADTDSIHKNLDYKSMPPSVFRLYVIELDTGMKINKEAYTPPPARFIDKKEIQIGKLPVTAAAGGRNLYSSDVVKDGQKRGTVGGSVKLYFSLDDILKWVFSKKERNKRRNRKRDDTWRYYNSMP
ncbi:MULTISPECIES: hypothetical protein [Parabacteroides]|uniref:hypothetical protein n=1 Tax=Parabacteroides leei TaxID=2939491 RepID=UPI00189BAB7C|nr:hypothetical protein [Parabacteroides goldsteinii]